MYQLIDLLSKVQITINVFQFKSEYRIAHSQKIRKLIINSVDTTKLASCSLDGTVKFWENIKGVVCIFFFTIEILITIDLLRF
jgi:WD40 repeat protein